MQSSCSQLVLVPHLCFRSVYGICCLKVCFPLPHINYYESDGLHLEVGVTEKVSPFPLLWTKQCCMLLWHLFAQWTDSALTLAMLALGWFGTEVVSKKNGKHTWLKGSSIAPLHQFNCLVKCFSDCVSWLKKSHDLLETYSGSTLLICLGCYHCYWALRRQSLSNVYPHVNVTNLLLLVFRLCLCAVLKLYKHTPHKTFFRDQDITHFTCKLLLIICQSLQDHLCPLPPKITDISAFT